MSNNLSVQEVLALSLIPNYALKLQARNAIQNLNKGARMMAKQMEVLAMQV